MSLYKEIDKLKYDKRLTDWHVSRGKLSKEDLQKHLSSLPDSADNVDNLSLTDDGSDDTDSFGDSGDQQ